MPVPNSNKASQHRNRFMAKPKKPSKSITTKSTKPAKAAKSSQDAFINDLQAQITALNLKLNEEKDAHNETRSEFLNLQASNTQNRGLRIKKLREEVEDLEEKLRVQDLSIDTLKLQLRDERQLRLQRDGTGGFVTVWKNDPALWMSFDGNATGGGEGGGKKRKRDDGGEAGDAERTAGDQEELQAQKKKQNEAWAARRKGQVDEDDEEEVNEELVQEMKIKLEKRAKAKRDNEKKKRTAAAPDDAYVDDQSRASADESWVEKPGRKKKAKSAAAKKTISDVGAKSWTSRMTDWMTSSKPVKKEAAEPIITNPTTSEYAYVLDEVEDEGFEEELFW